jgi:hypothetical protein
MPDGALYCQGKAESEWCHQPRKAVYSFKLGCLAYMTIKDEVIERAKKDLAKRRGILIQKIVLKQIQAVSWPDASLGCPQRGRVYAQVVTSGYLLVLSDGTADFEYHTDNSRRVVLCRRGGQSQIK